MNAPRCDKHKIELKHNDSLAGWECPIGSAWIGEDDIVRLTDHGKRSADLIIVTSCVAREGGS